MGDEVLAFVNGMGGTPVIELYVVYHELHAFLKGRGITISRNLIGSYITSLEMAGCSITLLKMDEDFTKLWDAPVKTAGLRRQEVSAGTITTTGDQDYGVPTTLAANTTLNAGAGNITFASTVTGAAFTLDANSTGTTRFGGAVTVGALTTNAGGTTQLNGNVTTTGTQTYGDNVRIDADLTLTTTNSAVLFSGTVDSEATEPTTSP